MSAPLSVKQYIKNLQKVHSMMLIGLVIFTIFISFTMKENNVAATGRNMTYLIIAGVVSVTMIFGSAFVYRGILKSKIASADMQVKLDGYKQACIVQYGMLEAPVLLSLVFFLITADILFAAFIGTGIVIFLLNRPSREQFINDVQLTEQEKRKLDAMD